MFSQVLSAAEPAVVALLGLVFAWLANEIRVKVHSTRTQGILLRLTDLAETVTNELSQTVVSGLKEAAADGTLTPDEAAFIKASAIARIKTHLGPKGVKEAMGVFGYKSPDQLGELIGSKVESAVVQSKQLAPSIGVLTTTGT